MQPASRRSLGGCRYGAELAIDVSELVDAPRNIVAGSLPDTEDNTPSEAWVSPDVLFTTVPAWGSDVLVVVSCLPDNASAKSLVDFKE